MAYGRSADCGRVYWLRGDGTVPTHQHGRALRVCPGGGQPPTELCKRNGDPLPAPKPKLPSWALKRPGWLALARLYQAGTPLPGDHLGDLSVIPRSKHLEFLQFVHITTGPNRGQWFDLTPAGRSWVEKNMDRHVELYPGADPREADLQVWHLTPDLRPFESSP